MLQNLMLLHFTKSLMRDNVIVFMDDRRTKLININFIHVIKLRYEAYMYIIKNNYNL